MTGRILCYLPAAGRGLVQTEMGDELVFCVPAEAVDLEGGDLVEFDMPGDGQRQALNVTLRQRWSQTLNEQYRPLVNQFHNTIQIQV